ncbi:hypothetical protein L9F63_004946 [Diploptera punctata]|uniref:Uncharacterized protein n=1 Tax=Diploptera punctata TaxID=6984 RepID=A0AAD7ZEJ9_DIPPU|nr:hypothetical protein L9F63_004946 [Diploptera punctata]
MQNSSLLQDAAYSYIEPGDGRTAGAQAGYQLIAVAVTVAIAVVTGFITGMIIKFPVLNKLTRDQYYDDAVYWEMPEDVQAHEQQNNKKDEDGKTVEAFVYDNSAVDQS